MTQGQPAQQLSLRVRLRDEATFENFHGARNAAAAARVRALVREPGPAGAVICGDQGVGKSHLLHAACLEAEQTGAAALCLSLDEAVQLSPEALEGLEQFDLVALDDLESLPRQRDWEEALLHLYNRLQDGGHHLLVSSVEPPASRNLALADLDSRLRSLPVIQLARPGDEERLDLLRVRAECRGLSLGEEVGGYILRRAPRDMGSLLEILERLDEASLQSQRRLTIPFVKSVMGW